MMKEISDEEWELICAIRNSREAGHRSPFELERYARDLFEELLE